MINFVIVAVLAFLIGMAVGIAGYCYTTIVAYEKEIEAIFDRVVEKYERRIQAKEFENRRLHSSLVEAQAKLAKGKEVK